MSFTCYILYSDDIQRYYVGSTSQSIEERLKKHLSSHSGFTSRAKDWRVVYMREFESKKEALDLEKKIKKRGAGRFLDGL